MYKLGSLVYAATLDQPAFDLIQRSSALQRALFRSLRALDLRIENFSETGQASGIAHWSLNFDTPKANFRARAQGFEITLLIPGRGVPSSFGNILEQVESSVIETLQEATIVGRDFTFNAHFELPPGGYQALTTPFSGEPPNGLGAPLAQGMSFYFHAPESGSESAITMDRSVVIVDGLYFQVRSRFSPQDFDLSSSFSSFGLLLTRVIEAANLGGAF